MAMTKERKKLERSLKKNGYEITHLYNGLTTYINKNDDTEDDERSISFIFTMNNLRPEKREKGDDKAVSIWLTDSVHDRYGEIIDHRSIFSKLSIDQLITIGKIAEEIKKESEERFGPCD